MSKESISGRQIFASISKRLQVVVVEVCSISFRVERLEREANAQTPAPSYGKIVKDMRDTHALDLNFIFRTSAGNLRGRSPLPFLSIKLNT
jgi:hypothetical protein